MQKNKYIKKEVSRPNETYKCTICEIEYDKGQIDYNWICPSCGEFILIQSYDEETSNTVEFIRKRADQLEHGDYIYYFGEEYRIKGITILNGKKTGMVRIGLENFGTKEVDINECMNCNL